jgi:hypothetical protein
MMSTKLPRINYADLSTAFADNLAKLSQRGTEAELGGDTMSGAELITFISTGMHELEKAQSADGNFVTVDDRAASLLQTFLARRAAETGKIVDGVQGTEAKFDSNDMLGWAGSLFDWLKGLKKHPFITHDDPPAAIGGSFRMGLLSDWGTGLYGAPVCASSLLKDGRFDMLMHLGDVYYSGDLDEVEERFLKLWPRIEGAVNRALNSNHEMYSGGYGYFDRILPDFQQRASYFACQNEHWLLIGLDTGYHEHELDDVQVAWLTRLINAAGTRRVVLFSHHQPFSLFESQGGKLVKQLYKVLDASRIFAWYWGHEHRCAIYDKHPVWNLYGRCIGHSGFPYFRDQFKNSALTGSGWVRLPGKNLVPGCELLDGPNPHIAGNGADYGPNGYVVLAFDGRTLIETVHDADGTVLRTESLQ